MTEDPSPPLPPAGRLRLTAYAAAHVALFAPVIVLLVLWLVGAALLVVWVGVGLVFVLAPVSRWVADLHRAMASRVLDSPVPALYSPLAGTGPVRRLQVVAMDPMTWRDLAWLLYAATVGFVLSLVTVLLLLVVATIGIWWFAAPALMRARCSVDRFFLTYGRTERLERRVRQLTETRADLVDHSAAELRRVERDLHDGAQARLVALSMSLGLAETAFDGDPDSARRLVGEAREVTRAAIGDLRSVVRGIHPPVLADRGLTGAVQALALDMALDVEVDAVLSGRPPAPVESAVYFAIAECLANIGKHARARHAWITVRHDAGRLSAVVGDDGRGGADPGAGTGMRGVMRRLGAFDGTMMVSSPPGGPTLVTLEVPCALSSPKTTPSSGPA